MWVCVCVAFVMCVCMYAWVFEICLGVGFVNCGCVYACVL